MLLRVRNDFRIFVFKQLQNHRGDLWPRGKATRKKRLSCEVLPWPSENYSLASLGLNMPVCFRFNHFLIIILLLVERLTSYHRYLLYLPLSYYDRITFQ
jgi:hypothetical protein